MTYSIETLLEGKYYRSRSMARRNKDGIIQSAEKRDNVWAGNNETAYAVRVRPTWKGEGIIPSDFWATVYVSAGE